jgi:SAM-dependent methyltransferase
VLDAGCGAGAQCEWLIDEGARVVGCDLSSAMVDETRRRCRGNGRFFAADLAHPLPLEPPASFYTSWPVAGGAELKLPGYNADSAKGVSYEIDLTKPVGERVQDLTFRGKPLDVSQKLRVAINNYRYTGGGGYSVYQGLPILEQPGVEIRDLLIDYLTRTGKIPPSADGNWKIVPPEAVAAMEKQAREEVADRTR